MKLASKEVQRSLYSYLMGDDTLWHMVNGNIYDSVPQQTGFPYIVIGEGVGRIIPADGVVVTECALEISVLTDGFSRRTALDIIERIYVLLHLGVLDIGSMQSVLLRADRSSVSLEENGNAMRGKITAIATVAEA